MGAVGWIVCGPGLLAQLARLGSAVFGVHEKPSVFPRLTLPREKRFGGLSFFFATMAHARCEPRPHRRGLFFLQTLMAGTA
jgi:hypothetical protein